MKIPRIRTKYVKKLKKMLSKSDPCSRCPYGRFYGLFILFITKKKCKTCLSFIGLSYQRQYNGITIDLVIHPCPCTRLGPRKALGHASSAILEWDLGKHKWQTGK